MYLKRFFTTLFFLLFPLLLTAQQTIDVTFRYTPSESAVRSFVPGSFNGWGPNSSGVISPSAVSLLTADEQYGFSYQTLPLVVGGGSESYQGASGYGYKFHEHFNQAGTQWQWYTDPINPIAIGANNDSFIEVTHPLIFQVEPFSNSVQRDDPPYLRAAVAALESDPIDPQASSITLNGTRSDRFADFYEEERQLLLVPSLSELGIDLNIGLNTVEIEAVTEAGVTLTQAVTFTYIATPQVTDQPRPAGLEDGITYHDDDPSKVSFSIYAPGREFVYVIGDHSDWQAKEEYLMKRDAPRADSVHFWLTIDDFTPGETYRFQYLVDGETRVADLFSELVLHPNLDAFITETIYPNMPQYPAGLTTEIVTVIEPGRTPFNWQVNDFERPPVDELLVYELLLRDFVEESSFEVLRDTLGYLERLGVNVIELMPVSEFDGNLSWGYNPVFHGALDKSYGSRTAFKRFVDEAHRRGMAVVLDVVYNHAHDNSPLIRTFGTQRSAGFETGNPLLGPGHAYNVFYHLNHDHPYIQYWLDRMNRYWLETYRVDGFRFDLTKGFASNVSNRSLLDGENPVRIANLKRMYDEVRKYDSDAYIILEHFAANSEERQLEQHGMLLWGNHNFNYSEGVMGYNEQSKSDMSGIYYGNRGFQNPHLIGYMESHDEQWIMHKARAFGNQSNADHDVRNLDTALQRMKLAGAFFFTIPGPKMLWQFGELGYGWNDGECVKPGDGSNGDCRPGDPGRTAEKPIRWDYYEEENRNRLYRSWSELARLRSESPAFTSRDTEFSSGLRGDTKWIRLEHPDMDVVIVGNFGVDVNSVAVDFPYSGEWHDFVTGRSETFSEMAVNVTLAPAEFRIYTSRKADPAEEGVFFAVGEQGFGGLPDFFTLEPNYPNPFQHVTRLNYDVPVRSGVSLKVYDLLGRLVAVLVDEPVHEPGTFTVSFEASGLSSGVYLARLYNQRESVTEKMLLIR
ncbi:MAG: T9SS C-terminal target domain-containing protein [Balneolaceae bacterium]|nr:MAG: T9SS C-terminal target domain-containing protein [Balneolaceae bacterium]